MRHLVSWPDPTVVHGDLRAVTLPVLVTMAQQNISKKRKFVADGVFYSELNEVRLRRLRFRLVWCLPMLWTQSARRVGLKAFNS